MTTRKRNVFVIVAIILACTCIPHHAATAKDKKQTGGAKRLEKSIGSPVVRKGQIRWWFDMNIGLQPERHYLIAVTYENKPIRDVSLRKVEVKDDTGTTHGFEDLGIKYCKNCYQLTVGVNQGRIPRGASELTLAVRIWVNEFDFIAEDKITRDKEGNWRDSEGKLLKDK